MATATLKAPELGSIDTAIALDYFWQVVPNYTGELDATVGLSFHFPVDDVSKLEAALGAELSATDLFFFKASGNTGENPFLDLGSVSDLQFKVFQNGVLPSTGEWQLSTRGSNTLVGTMDLDGFSWGGIFAIRQITPLKEALALTQFSLSPNPSTGILQLRFASPNSENLQIQVTNALGEPLYQQQLFMVTGDNQVELSLEKLPAGLYFLLLQNERGKKMSRKFFIQN